MTYGEHPSVNDVKPAALQPVADSAAAEPEADELAAATDAVLTLRERRDRRVEFARMQFGPYDGPNCMRVVLSVVHAPRLSR